MQKQSHKKDQKELKKEPIVNTHDLRHPHEEEGYALRHKHEEQNHQQKDDIQPIVGEKRAHASPKKAPVKGRKAPAVKGKAKGKR